MSRCSPPAPPLTGLGNQSRRAPLPQGAPVAAKPRFLGEGLVGNAAPPRKPVQLPRPQQRAALHFAGGGGAPGPQGGSPSLCPAPRAVPVPCSGCPAHQPRTAVGPGARGARATIPAPPEQRRPVPDSCPRLASAAAAALWAASRHLRASWHGPAGCHLRAGLGRPRCPGGGAEESRRRGEGAALGRLGLLRPRPAAAGTQWGKGPGRGRGGDALKRSPAWSLQAVHAPLAESEAPAGQRSAPPEEGV